ncbi:MAG: hypothetical protein K5683_01175 [Prevotella sp.]|nr:hypothetical protein [Prevotella sp.]
MKKFVTILTILMFALTIGAQDNRLQQHFSPERFEADLQQFITKEAKLSQEEADKFFPLYKEMQEKQRALFERQRELAKVKPNDEKGCLKVLKESDDIDLELKRIQKRYHLHFLDLMPASKVYDILQAEMRFHRHMMRSWSRPTNTNFWQHPRRNFQK